jgi:uncharacterized protein YbjT (DUF2867 family)
MPIVASPTKQIKDFVMHASPILVTGATGKTGRRLLNHLARRGQVARSASRRGDGGSVVFDWHKPTTFAPALDGARAVYLVAPEFVEDPSDVVAAFLEQARRSGVESVVVLSSMGVDFPHEPRDSGRRNVERAVSESGLRWTILRPTGFAQNFSEGFLLPAILQAGAVATATGAGAVAFVDADDIAAVAACALTEPGHAHATHVITGPWALSFGEAADAIAKASGRAVVHHALPRADMAELLQQAGMPADYVEMILRDQDAIREGYGAHVTDTVARLTGRPARSFDDFVHAAADVWAVG